MTPALRNSKNKVTRPLAALAFAGVCATSLAGCTTFGVDQDLTGIYQDVKNTLAQFEFGQSCQSDLSRRLNGVDWSFAEVVNIHIRQNEFNPMVVSLQKDQPYVFRLTNRDEDDHTFRARDFFRNVAVASVPGYGPDLSKLESQTDSFGAAMDPAVEPEAAAQAKDGPTEFEQVMGATPGKQRDSQAKPDASATMGPDPFVSAMKGALAEGSETETGDAAEASAPPKLQPAAATDIMGVSGEKACALHVASVDVPARKTVEVRLVAVNDGRYPFEDTFLFVPSFYIGGAAGVVVIE